MTTESEPVPPEFTQKYVHEGIKRQDSCALQEIAQWAEELAAWKDREVAVEEIENDLAGDEQINDVVEETRGTIVRRRSLVARIVAVAHMVRTSIG